MPKFLWKVIGVVVLILILFLGVVYVSSLFPTSGTNSSNWENNSQPTYNATAGAEFTPDGGQNDIVEFVATAYPVTNHSITEAAKDAMNHDLADKPISLTEDDLTGSSLTLSGVSWYCFDISPLPNSVFGAAEAFEGRWSMVASLSGLTYTAEQGSLAPEVCTLDANGYDTNCVAKYNAKVTVTISQISVDGPVVLVGNNVPFNYRNDRAMATYSLILWINTMITGNDLIAQYTMDAIGIVQDQVKLETIAPGASNEKLMGLYNDFVASFSTPGTNGVTHTYDSLVRLLTPVAQAHDFAGIESITLVIPPASTNIYGWNDLLGEPLIPSDYPARYADSKCPSATPTEADIDLLFPQSPTP